MSRWSDWYDLSENEIEHNGIDESGVYQIAFKGNYYYNYPNGRSPIFYIGSAPVRTLKTRLKEHIMGRGHPCVYALYNKYALIWQDMKASDPESTEINALERFKEEFGDLPRCNNKIG